MLRIVLVLLGAFVMPLSAQTEPPLPHRCINLGNTLEAPVEGEWGFIIAESDMQTIAAAGFDTVRIPIRWSVHAADEAPYTIDAEFFARNRRSGLFPGVTLSGDKGKSIPRTGAGWREIPYRRCQQGERRFPGFSSRTCRRTALLSGLVPWSCRNKPPVPSSVSGNGRQDVARADGPVRRVDSAKWNSPGAIAWLLEQCRTMLW